MRCGRDVPDCDFLISCVDTRAARATLARITRLKTRKFDYWIDTGNSSASGQFVLDGGADLIGRAYGHGALVDDHLVVLHEAADRASGREHMLQIGRAVLAGRRADSNELDRAVVDCVRGVGGEVQAPGGDIARDHGVQAGLVDRHAARLKQRDLGGVHVQADNVVPHIGEAGARDEAHIAGADDGDFHQAAFLARASVRS